MKIFHIRKISLTSVFWVGFPGTGRKTYLSHHRLTITSMIKNWLQLPPDQPNAPGASSNTLGARLPDHKLRQSYLRKLKVAIVGLDADFANRTRRALYDLAWDFGELALADLGDVRNESPEFVIPLLRELQSGGILPILVGGEVGGFRAQYQAFRELNREISLLMADQRIRLSAKAKHTKAKSSQAKVLDPIFHAKRRKLYHLTHLGSQRHLVDPDLYQALDDRNFQYVRLGEARADLAELEPIIRDADLFGLDLGVIKKLEAPAQLGQQPSGFDLTELTQLCRYAGMSDKLVSFGVFGAAAAADPADLDVTAAAAAQLIWYFLDGFANRKGDFPASVKGMTEYVVDVQYYDRITFWKSPRSGRWWIQAPAAARGGEERHRLIPCSYADYLRAVEQEVPERLITAFRRYE